MNKIIYFTQKGLEEKKSEYEKLLQQRPDAVKELSKAREMGDLSENGYYKSARFKLSDIDRRLRQVKHLLKIAKVKSIQQSDVVDIGTTVTISDGTTEKIYAIVGTYEASPADGKISLDSPLGKALSGKKVGEKTTVQLADRSMIITILKLS